MTWARQHAPQTQRAITAAYTTIGEEVGAVVVPVGSVWQSFLAKHDQPALYDRDQSHSSLAGSYLAACVFLAVLLKESPVGIESESSGLSRPELKRLQTVAWKQCGTGGKSSGH